MIKSEKNKIINKKILVISNDAGATEYISHIILNEKKYEWIVYALLNSLAAKIFEKYNIEFNYFFELDELSDIVKRDNPNIILYGTGWQVDFSSVVKKSCLKNNIKSIALIDHWTNYTGRFSENSLPDLILVMDDLANEIAVQEFDFKVDIAQIKNYFIESVISDFSALENKTFDSIVFMSSPSVVNKVNPNAYEYTLVEDLLSSFGDITIRLHPSEDENKYTALISKFPKINVTIVKPYEEDLLVTLSKSKLTVGTGSMALYLSYLLGINTISYVSSSNIKPKIPIPKQYIINDLNEVDNIKFTHENQVSLNNNEIGFENMIQCLLKDS